MSPTGTSLGGGRTSVSGLLIVLPAILILASLVGATVILARYSLNTWRVETGMVATWSLANYEAVLSDPVVHKSFLATFRVSAVVTIICILLGYPAAYAIKLSKHRSLLVFLVISPMLIDVVVRYYAWILLLGQNGFVNFVFGSLGLWPAPKRLLYNEISVAIGMIHEFVPLMVLPILNVLERIDPSVQEAAMSLRAGPIRTFFRITLPLSLPGVVAGTLLTFALSTSAFVAPLILGGGRVTTLTILMQQNMFTTLNWPMGATESLLLVAVVMLLLMLYRRQLSTPVKHAGK